MHRPDCHTAHNYSTINIMEAPDYLNVVDYDIQHYMTCHYMFLTWNPQGKRKRGRPKRCRHDLIADIEEVWSSWRELERMTQDRRRWRRK